MPLLINQRLRIKITSILNSKFICRRKKKISKDKILESSEMASYIAQMCKEKTNINDGQYPELYTKREECCGCSACYAACPMSGLERPPIAYKMDKEGKNLQIEIHLLGNSELTEFREHTGAITMLPDEEGFLYPVIDPELCIKCYKCVKACPIKSKHKIGTIL